MKIILMGNSDAKKAFIQNSSKQSQASSGYRNTIGADFCVIEINNETVQLWDLGSRQSTMSPTIFKETGAVLLISPQGNEKVIAKQYVDEKNILTLQYNQQQNTFTFENDHWHPAQLLALVVANVKSTQKQDPEEEAPWGVIDQHAKKEAEAKAKKIEEEKAKAKAKKEAEEKAKKIEAEKAKAKKEAEEQKAKEEALKKKSSASEGSVFDFFQRKVTELKLKIQSTPAENKPFSLN